MTAERFQRYDPALVSRRPFRRQLLYNCFIMQPPILGEIHDAKPTPSKGLQDLEPIGENSAGG